MILFESRHCCLVKSNVISYNPIDVTVYCGTAVINAPSVKEKFKKEEELNIEIKKIFCNENRLVLTISLQHLTEPNLNLKRWKKRK